MEYVIILAYFAALLAIGAAASRRVHDQRDYYVGGKNMGYWVVAFSARATGESAWLYLGLTGLGALVGVRAFWVVVGEVVGVALAWFLMARPFKEATDRYGSITIPDYFASRFADSRFGSARTLRLFAGAALAVFVTIYVSAQIDATGKAFDSFLGWNYTLGALVGFGIVVVYTLSGGFVAVAWSDLFQGSLMVLGLTLLPVAAWLVLAPPEGMAFAALGEGYTSLWGAGGPGVSNALIIFSYLAIGLGFLGSPQVFVRFISIRGQEEIRAGRWVAIAFTVLTDSSAVLIGMTGHALLVGSGGDFAAMLGVDGERVLPELVAAVFPPVVAGLYVAAVLAASMSTIDSLLLVASSAITRDVYQQILRPDLVGRPLKRLSRGVTLALAAVALATALTVSTLSPDRTIFWYAIFGWSGIAATFCPALLLALAWPRYDARGALVSMVTGALCIPLFKFGVPLIPVWGPMISKAEELGPSFLVSLLAGVLVTLASPRSEDRVD
jgi:sodium/proline symporter